jgi:hypothetical protein
MITTLLLYGALTIQGYPIYIHSDTPICVVSLKGSGITVSDDVIPLNVPEYMNATTSTVGIPGCSNYFLFGYSKNKKITSGFFINEDQIEIK